MRRGPQKKGNTQVEATILEVLERTGCFKWAAREAGIHEDTLKLWREEKSAFSAQVQEALNVYQTRSDSAINAAFRDGLAEAMKARRRTEVSETTTQLPDGSTITKKTVTTKYDPGKEWAFRMAAPAVPGGFGDIRLSVKKLDNESLDDAIAAEASRLGLGLPGTPETSRVAGGEGAPGADA
jgi:hypothetical protein